MCEASLLPCPFCGGDASGAGVIRYTDSHEAWWADGTQIIEAFYANCMACSATSKGMCGQQTKELAVAAWNRRAFSQPDDLTAAAQLERSGLISREKYNHIVENIRARDRMREAMA